MSRWVNSSGSRRYTWTRVAPRRLFWCLLLISLLTACWMMPTEPYGMGTYYLTCYPINSSDLSVYPSRHFSPNSFGGAEPHGAHFSKEGLNLKSNTRTGVLVAFDKGNRPKQADGLFELKNVADEPRRIFAVQDGGSKHDELKHSRQLEQLGITARELFDRLSDKLKSGGADALTAYWEEVHRLRPDIALLIPPKSTVALPWR